MPFDPAFQQKAHHSLHNWRVSTFANRNSLDKTGRIMLCLSVNWSTLSVLKLFIQSLGKQLLSSQFFGAGHDIWWGCSLCFDQNKLFMLSRRTRCEWLLRCSFVQNFWHLAIVQYTHKNVQPNIHHYCWRWCSSHLGSLYSKFWRSLATITGDYRGHTDKIMLCS